MSTAVQEVAITIYSGCTEKYILLYSLLTVYDRLHFPHCKGYVYSICMCFVLQGQPQQLELTCCWAFISIVYQTERIAHGTWSADTVICIVSNMPGSARSHHNFFLCNLTLLKHGSSRKHPSTENAPYIWATQRQHRGTITMVNRIYDQNVKSYNNFPIVFQLLLAYSY